MKKTIKRLFWAINKAFVDSFEIKEESYYHPATGYKGSKSNMDTYITNRERKLKNK